MRFISSAGVLPTVEEGALQHLCTLRQIGSRTISVQRRVFLTGGAKHLYRNCRNLRNDRRLAKGLAAVMGPPTYQVSRPTIASKQAEVFKYADGAEGAAGLSDIVQKAEKAAIADHGAFTVVLSGGSLINGLVPLAKLSSVDFSKWYVFYVDERNVPHSSADSNHKGAFDAFLSKVPIPAEQIFAIKECVPVAEAAADYEARLKDPSGDPLASNPLSSTNPEYPTTTAQSTSYSPQDMGENAASARHIQDCRTENLVPHQKRWSAPRVEAVFDLILLGVGPDGMWRPLFPGRSEIKGAPGFGYWTSGSGPPSGLAMGQSYIRSSVGSGPAGKGCASTKSSCCSGDLLACICRSLPTSDVYTPGYVVSHDRLWVLMKSLKSANQAGAGLCMMAHVSNSMYETWWP
eukprot:jgi/Botrbrau1/8679/Bobra.0087s0032.1